MARDIFKMYCSPKNASDLDETEPERFPEDFDQYESPASYEYDDVLPDDADVVELEEERDRWQ